MEREESTVSSQYSSPELNTSMFLVCCGHDFARQPSGTFHASLVLRLTVFILVKVASVVTSGICICSSVKQTCHGHEILLIKIPHFIRKSASENSIRVLVIPQVVKLRCIEQLNYILFSVCWREQSNGKFRGVGLRDTLFIQKHKPFPFEWVSAFCQIIHETVSNLIPALFSARFIWKDELCKCHGF